MPSSVRVGSRPPRSCLIFSYSSGVRPCCRRVSGEKAEVKEVAWEELLLSHLAGRMGRTNRAIWREKFLALARYRSLYRSASKANAMAVFWSVPHGAPTDFRSPSTCLRIAASFRPHAVAAFRQTSRSRTEITGRPQLSQAEAIARWNKAPSAVWIMGWERSTAARSVGTGLEPHGNPAALTSLSRESEMIEDVLHGDQGRLFEMRSRRVDQLHGLRQRQFGSLVVDEAGNGIPARQQLDSATKQHLKFARRSCNHHQSCPAGVQPESERGGSAMPGRVRARREGTQVDRPSPQKCFTGSFPVRSEST